MILIGFGNRARQGKDYAVKTIIEARGNEYDVRRYSFAQELKREVTEAAQQFGGYKELIRFMQVNHQLPAWVKYDPAGDMTDPDCPLGKQRTLLQWWGNEYRRAKDPFYWVSRLRKRLDEEKPQFALISDMRFYNEMLFVKSMGGYTVRVVRSGYQDPEAGAVHASEVELDGKPYDFTITVGDGEVAELRKLALITFDSIVKKETLDIPWDFTVEEFERELREGVVGTTES